MQAAAAMLQDYTLKCSAGFASLKSSYAVSHRAEKKAHAVLKKVWAAAVPRLGLLAARIVDSNIFNRLATSDAGKVDVKAILKCDKNVTEQLPAFTQAVAEALNQGFLGQTQKQVVVVLNEMEVLAARHSFGGLGSAPNAEDVAEAAKRLQDSSRDTWSAMPDLAKDLVAEWQARNCI